MNIEILLGENYHNVNYILLQVVALNLLQINHVGKRKSLVLPCLQTVSV